MQKHTIAIDWLLENKYLLHCYIQVYDNKVILKLS